MEEIEPLSCVQTLSDVILFLSFPKSLDTVRQNLSRYLATLIYSGLMRSYHVLGDGKVIV